MLFFLFGNLLINHITCKMIVCVVVLKVQSESSIALRGKNLGTHKQANGIKSHCLRKLMFLIAVQFIVAEKQVYSYIKKASPYSASNR